MSSSIEKLCAEKNIKLTENRKIIARVISDSSDHPDVDEVYNRAIKVNPDIGIATVYRAVRMFEECGVIAKHDFGGKGKARYEVLEDDQHHDHLVNVESGEVLEFFNEELEELKTKVAKKMGFELVDHKLELYGKPIKK